MHIRVSRGSPLVGAGSVCPNQIMYSIDGGGSGEIALSTTSNCMGAFRRGVTVDSGCGGRGDRGGYGVCVFGACGVWSRQHKGCAA